MNPTRPTKRPCVSFPAKMPATAPIAANAKAKYPAGFLRMSHKRREAMNIANSEEAPQIEQMLPKTCCALVLVETDLAYGIIDARSAALMSGSGSIDFNQPTLL